METGTLSLALLHGRRRGIDGGTGEFALDRMPSLGGLDMRVGLQDATVVFDRDGCREASGSVRVVLSAPTPAMPTLELSGSPVCDGALARLVLAQAPGAPDAIDLEATFETDRDGAYRLDMLARSDDPALRLGLQAAGFQPGPAGLSRVASGHLVE